MVDKQIIDEWIAMADDDLAFAKAINEFLEKQGEVVEEDSDKKKEE